MVVVAVDGEVAAGFEPVRDALAAVLDQQGGGAALAAFVDGVPVVDLWGGTVGAASLVHTWSAAKPLVAAAVLVLVERGRLRLDQPVEEVWPELGAARGGSLQVGHVLSHQAGLVSVPGGDVVGLLDWGSTCRALEAAQPDWPGCAAGEHALTFGHLAGELVRRVDGRSIGAFLAEEIAGPLGLDVHVGLDPSARARVVDLEGVSADWWEELRGPAGTLRHRAFGGGVGAELVNGEAWRAAEVPAVNGHATARGLAGFWAAWLAGRVPAGLGEVAWHGHDLVLGRTVGWTLGSAQASADELGMGGVGGQWAGTRPRLGLAWAFLTTVMGSFDRVEAVERALLGCL